MTTPIDVEPREPVKHAPPTILLLFTFFTAVGVIVAGAWIVHSVAITILGVLGIPISLLGLRFARNL